MSQVPFLDVGAAYQELAGEIDSAVGRVLDSGRYILGPEVEQFENEFADYCEAEHCIGVGNGLDALQLALLACGIGPGDEVIVAANSFIATLLAVSRCGAFPVPVEPDAATYNLDPERVEAAITPRTRAILPTHLYGQPADLDPMIEIAQSRGLRLIEDAAQAHGARYRGRRIGSHGDAVAWSFYPGKNLGAFGDGGAVTTSDATVAAEVRRLRSYGSTEKYVHEVKGFNSRLDPIQAAALSVKLRRLDEWNARRTAIAELYSERLSGSGLTLPYVPQWAEPSWHLYVVRSDRRDRLVESLSRRGVETLIHYPVPPHRQHAYPELAGLGLPITEQLAAEVLSLPIGPHLPQDQAVRVVDALVAGQEEIG